MKLKSYLSRSWRWRRNFTCKYTFTGKCVFTCITPSIRFQTVRLFTTRLKQFVSTTFRL